MARWRAPMLLLLTMCAAPAAVAQTPPRELMIWGVGFGPDSKGLEAVVREFERRRPGVRVRVLNMGAGGMNPQKLMTAIVGKAPPDVIHQDRFTIGDWASRGAFRALNDLVARDMADDDCPREELYYPSAWQEATYEGKIYAIPAKVDNRALYWNRKIFREKARELRAAGLDPERPPATWSETLAYSRVLTEFDRTGNIRRAGFLPNFGNVWLYMYAFQANASFMSDDGERCTLYSPEAEEALRFMAEGYAIVGGYEKAMAFQTGFQTGENDPFALGKVAMKIDGDWILNNLARYTPDLDFAVEPAPVPDDRYHRRGRFAKERDRFVTWSGGFSYAIPAGARNVDLAWDFIKWASSVEALLLEARAQRDWERRRGRDYIPRQPANMRANEAIFREFKPSDPKFAAALRTHMDLMPVSRFRPVTFVGQMLWDEHVRALERACMGTLSPADALLRGQAVVQRELDAEFAKKRRPVVDLRWPFAIGFGGFLGACVGIVVAYRRKRLGRLARQEARWAYLFIAPWAAGFLVFVLGPMLASIFFSLTQYNVLSEPRWVGLANFADLFSADWKNVSKALANIAYLVGLGVPLSLLTGLSLALLLNGAVRGMRFYRTFFYMPAIVPTVASAVLWLWLLAGDPNKGLINAGWQATISQWFEMPPPGWLNAEAWAKPSLILMGMWGAGSGMILWLAGLKGVPASLYEAASIDGANGRQQFVAVTLPQLSPIIFFNAVMGIIAALQEFDRVYIMRTPEGNPGPNDSLLVPVYHLFTNGFGYFKMGYASALAWLIFAIILALTLFQFLIAPRWVHYEGER